MIENAVLKACVPTGGGLGVNIYLCGLGSHQCWIGLDWEPMTGLATRRGWTRAPRLLFLTSPTTWDIGGRREEGELKH